MELKKSLNMKTIFIVALLFAGIVHFSLPLVLTYDSGHYFNYLDILSGKRDWDDWDRVRQPGFPLMLQLTKQALGVSQHSFLIVYFAIFAAIFRAAILFLWKNFNSKLSIITGTSLIFIFVIMDPLVVGYFHVLLTEAVAATICASAIFYGISWVNHFQESGHKSKLKTALRTIGWASLITVSYHLKQSYVFCCLIPFITATAIVVCKHYKEAGTLKSSTFSMLGVAITLLSSIFAWANYLPPIKDSYMQERDPVTMGSRILVLGMNSARSVGTVSSFLSAGWPQSIREKLQGEIKMIDPAAEASNSCTQVYQLGADDDADYAFLHCDGKRPTVGQVFSFLASATLKAPSAVFSGYWESLLRATRVLPSGAAAGGRKYSISLENEAIGLRAFSGLPNIFHMPQHLAENLENFRHARPEESAGFFGMLPYKLFKGQSRYVFTFTLLFTLLALPVLIYLLFIVPHRHYLKPETLLFATITSCTSWVHFLVHIALGASIDRYAFPIYFTGLFAICFIAADVANFKRFAK